MIALKESCRTDMKLRYTQIQIQIQSQSQSQNIQSI